MAKAIRLEHAIFRVDDERRLIHGWMVRMDRRGVAYRQFFGDEAGNGKDAALAAARAFRDDILARLAPASQQAEAKYTEGASSIAGLSLHCTKETRHLAETEQHWYWRASWVTARGEKHWRDFPILEHGEQGAFTKALEARRAGADSLKGLTVSLVPKACLA